MFRSLLLLLYLFHFNALVLAAEEGPMQIIKSIFEKSNSDKFISDVEAQNFVTSQFDYGAMTKSILAAEVKKRSLDEIEWFKNQISAIVTKTVYPKVYEFLAKVTLSHQIYKKGDVEFSVLTIVKKRGEETEVIGLFRKINGLWKIVDITIDDESWVENIKEQVHKTIKKKNWSGLKAALVKRLDELNSGKTVKESLDDE